MQRRSNRQGFGLALLAMQIANVGVDKIPPVTLATIGAQVAIFLNLVREYFPSASGVCISVYSVWYKKQWQRIILSTFYHADDMHLYYNMASFLWKGRSLEKKFKSAYFTYLLVVFSVLTSLTYIALNILFETVLENESYVTQCAVGFSGVIFALKVLTTYYSPPGIQYVMGLIPVPSRYVFWAELVIIQMLVPNASFTGHLAGILVGLAYIKGPLKPIMDSFLPPAPSYSYTQSNSGYRYQNQYTEPRNNYNRPPPSSTNHEPQDNFYREPDPYDLRQRRMNRFQ